MRWVVRWSRARATSRRFWVAFLVGIVLAVAFVTSRVMADPSDDASSPSAVPSMPKSVASAVARAMNGAARAQELTLSLDFDEARAVLASADAGDPAIIVAKARLALYEEDCDSAVTLLAHPSIVQDDETRLMADVARGCARVTAATLTVDDPQTGIFLRFQDDADRVLAPSFVDTIVKARASLARDLGVAWKKPLRVTVVRDLLSLSAMTGLPYKSAQTTGTVAVAKWGRVTILSPRASRHGFPFRDTLTHELTHLAIAMQTLDRAPLWLHEGVARREETRWREPSVFDGRPSPESIVQHGMGMKLDLPLDKLGPSIAMLPSAEAATVAFAEVTSFVRFFVESTGPDALARLLVSLRTAKSVDGALSDVSGQTLAQWDVRWRAELAKLPKEPLSPLLGLGSTPPGFRDSRERARLAELLLGRDHAAEALSELDKVPSDLLADPSLRYLRARVLEATDRVQDATALLQEPKDWIASFGPCWAMRARLARARGDLAMAEASEAEALAHDPFAVETACGTLPKDALAKDAPPSAPNSATPTLCDAAKARKEPDIGRD